jgi:hypothetical protein
MDLLNQRFGNLKVIALAGNDAWLCRCGDHKDAPKLLILTRRQLLSGATSCGCMVKPKVKATGKRKVAVPA